MHTLLLILYLFNAAPTGGHADSTIYYDNKWLPINPATDNTFNTAYYRRSFTKEADLYKVEDYGRGGKLIMTGYTNACAADISNMRQGKYVYYQPGEKLHKQKEGNYNNGYPVGRWTSYYKGTDSIKEETDYKEGKIISRKRYESGTGRLTSEIQYAEKTSYATAYKYYPSGSLEQKSTIVNDTTRSSICYSESGSKIACDTSSEDKKPYQLVERVPVAPYNIHQYLGKNIRYPESAIDKNKQGSVYVSFVVAEDGCIDDVEIRRGVSPDLDEEAIRVISTMPNWKPGMRDGKPVKVQYTQPVTYKLAD